ncbi:MAG: urea carboxylase-associated family protein [Bdellovibrionota bacterium]
MQIIPPRTGTGFLLTKGSKLRVTDIEGEQVSDFFCVVAKDHKEYLSSGRTIDYLSRINFKEGDILYSSRSLPMVKIVKNTVATHDFLLTPCSADTFRIIYGDKNPHRGCEGNLREAFRNLDVDIDAFPATFNCFMNVPISPDGIVKVLPPSSKAGDFIEFEALEDLLVGLTACSALQSNNYRFKPIGFDIIRS